MSKVSDRKYSKMFRSAAKCDMRPVSWLVPDYVPRRNITLFHGPGEGWESLMALHHAAKISRGKCLEFDASGEPPTEGCVLILAQEDSVEDTIKPRLDLAGADMSRIYFRATGKDIRLPEDIEALRWLVREKRVVLVIIDTLDDFATTSTKNNQSVRKVLNGLGNLAEEEDVAIIVICHWTKQRSNKGSLRNKIAGSFGILSRGRCAYAFVRDPEDQGILMVSTKGNLGGRKPTVLFDVDVQPVQIDGRPVDHPKILYRDTSPITEDDFEGASSKVDEAVEYLEKALRRVGLIAGKSLRAAPLVGKRFFMPRNKWVSRISEPGATKITAASGNCPRITLRQRRAVMTELLGSRMARLCRRTERRAWAARRSTPMTLTPKPMQRNPNSPARSHFLAIPTRQSAIPLPPLLAAMTKPLSKSNRGRLNLTDPKTIGWPWQTRPLNGKE